jgi:hypothetical protein
MPLDDEMPASPATTSRRDTRSDHDEFTKPSSPSTFVHRDVAVARRIQSAVRPSKDFHPDVSDLLVVVAGTGEEI